MSRRVLRRLLDSLADFSARPHRDASTCARVRRRNTPLGIERLEDRRMMAADVIISEFMADNESGVLDVDVDNSDWVELYNRGDAPQNMTGWRLTDNATRLDKWVFPSITIQPGQSLLVWATSKDRRDPAAQLHTNFGLSKDGEYLGLVRSDSTIATEFRPSFPGQFPDVSYGYNAQATTTALVTHASPAKAHIPTSNSLGTSWTSESFVPGANWINGPSQGVGYDTEPTYLPLIRTNVGAMRNVNPSAYIRIPFDGATGNFGSLSMRIRYDDGFAAYINGQRVVVRNAPATPTWNSRAVADRIDSTAIQFETIDLSAYARLIHSGTNVLAIHAMNVVASSSDLLIDAELTGSSVTVQTAQAPRFFRTVTPGQPNVAGTLDTRPLISDVTNSAPSDAANLQVAAQVAPAGSPIAGVHLHYRVMYGQEVIVNMFDDGAHGDGAAGDGRYGGSIPAAASSPGQMVRYYVTASTAANTVGRFPFFTNPNSTSQYMGTVIPNPSVTSELEIFQVFVQNPNWFRNSNGTINQNLTSASLFHNGRFYDNIHINTRGQTSIQDAFPNQKFKFEFNDDNRFIYPDGHDVGSFNLDNMYQDPSYARLTLGMEVFREAGAYAQLVEPVHTRMNGQFYSLGVLSERYNKPFLDRNGLGDEGAVYESEGIFLGRDNLSPNAGNLGTTAGMEKDNREWETSFGDLQAFVNGISPSNPNRMRYIFDNVNIPEVLNVLAGYSLTKHYDRDTHNFFVYRDSDGNGEWSLLPYDLDLIWDRLREPVFSTFFSGHPFEGSSQDPTWAGTHWNRLVDAFADIPVLREMVLRRLRTLMDEILQPPGTPYAERYLENRADQLHAELLPEARLDYAKWGGKSGGAWGGPWAVGIGLADLKAKFNARRNYLYGLNIIPGAQAAAPNLIIGEVDHTPLSGVANSEYIQIRNPGTTAVDVSGWKIGGAVDYTFDKGVIIPAGGSVYAVKDVKLFRARTFGPGGGKGLFAQGNYDGDLAWQGETIRLFRPDGAQANSLTYVGLSQAPVMAPIEDFSVVAGVTSASIAIAPTDPNLPLAEVVYSATTSPNVPVTFHFQPGVDPTFRFTVDESYVGVFTATIVATVGQSQTSESFVIESLPGAQLVGDFDRSGLVDGADIDVWRDLRELALVATPPASGWSADGDSDGDVDAADFMIWQRNVGQRVSVAGSARANTATLETVEAADTDIAFESLTQRAAWDARPLTRLERRHPLVRDAAALDNSPAATIEQVWQPKRSTQPRLFYRPTLREESGESQANADDGQVEVLEAVFASLDA